MIDTRREIEQRLSVLRGLVLSGVNHAADMLTLSFGALRPVTNFRGKLKHVGEWALHVQCTWRLEEAGRVVAMEDDLRGPDEKAHASAHRLREILVEHGTVTVEAVSVSDAAGVVLSMSRGFRLTVTPDVVQDDEDWRFFAPGVDAAHLVIVGGKIAPESFD
ncbi:hypothetical protein [Paraburkholderia diazotrophica]|uniref:Uncharacterized protein n=1 Tax=Paraburkholderia diazotrophica TaxID=667676 RepID=A0A1H7E5K4_9BURK|nr:hypothetical protein [Paraburkholderia diazotrophica]SEK09209.1 hypothetical protein SAMN05192539_104339 [Paraburkholderia diazotrophica]